MIRFKAALAIAVVLASSAVAVTRPGAHHHSQPVRLALKAAPSM